MRWRLPKLRFAFVPILACAAIGYFCGSQITRRYTTSAWLKLTPPVQGNPSSSLPLEETSDTIRRMLLDVDTLRRTEQALMLSFGRLGLILDVRSHQGAGNDRVIEIRVDSRDRDTATQIANFHATGGVNLWKEKEKSARDSALRTLDEKISRLRGELSVIDEAKKEFLTKTPEAAFLDTPEAVKDRLIVLKKEFDAGKDATWRKEMEMKRIEAEMERSRKQFVESPDPEPTDAAIIALRNEISTTERQYQEFSARWTESNPKMIKIRERLDEKKTELADKIKSMRDEDVSKQNALLESKTAELGVAEKEFADLDAERKRLENEVALETQRIADVQERVPSVRRQIEEFDEQKRKLQIDLEVAERESAQRKMDNEPATASSALSLYRSADQTESRTGDGPVLGCLAGGITGYVLAFILLLLRLNLRRSFLDIAQVEEELGHPVLGRFPKRG